MTYFKNINSIEDLKKLYRKLCQKNHPDNGGNVETMAKINNEYAERFNELKKAHNEKAAADESGNTRPISKKKMWYWRSEKDAVRSKGAKSMEYIRSKYGSETYSTSDLFIA